MNLEAFALRAVELAVQGRADPRLLVATRRHLPKPKTAARLIAGLANAAAGRQALLLVGLRGFELLGVSEAPNDDWWNDTVDALPGAVPDLAWTLLDTGDVDVLVVGVGHPDELIVATRKGSSYVPWFDGRRLSTAPPTPRPESSRPTETVPAATITSVWVERATIAGAADHIHVYQGVIDMELDAISGRMDDASCSATLLMTQHEGPIALEIQVHPAVTDVGVIRNDHGIEVRSTFRANVFVAAAVPAPTHQLASETAQLVVSLPLPGRSVPELRSLLLSADPEAAAGTRWVG